MLLFVLLISLFDTNQCFDDQVVVVVVVVQVVQVVQVVIRYSHVFWATIANVEVISVRAQCEIHIRYSKSTPKPVASRAWNSRVGESIWMMGTSS
jgi:hypothetical protein